MIMSVLHLAAILLLSYLAGSIPTSVIVGKLFFGTDIRTKGSGNAGGTNAFRVFGWKAGTVVVVVDIAKGAIATLFISRIPEFANPDAALLTPDALAISAGCAAVLGHVWTIFGRFHGGKGVAAAAGMVLALYPLALASAVALFALVAISTGIISVASLSAAICFPFIVLLFAGTGVVQVTPLEFWFTIPLALLIVFTHRKNIRRLLHGEENRFQNLMVLKRLFSRSRHHGN